MAKRKQRRLPGMELPTNKKIEKAAEAYVEVRDKRMGLTKQEVELRTALLTTMKAEGFPSGYEFDGMVIEITAKEKVKVRRADDAEDDSEE